MIPASEYVAPEPRECEGTGPAIGWEFIDPHGYSLDRRTRWVTQRTLQAVGTGVLFAWRLCITTCLQCFANAGNATHWTAHQSARIGQGAQ